jgi:hypothetical protein
MREFILLFRQPSFDYSSATPTEMQELSKRWNDWAENIEEQGKLVNRGPRLASDGKVLKSGGVITDGPFVEVREILGSFIIVKAESLDEATTMAHGCPAIDQGGSVEIRPVYGG